MAKPLERRTVSARLEVRESGSSVGLRGYASMFDSAAHGEVVKPAAFNRTLAQRDNVRLLVNHEGVPLASTKSGTMRLLVDERGLLVEVDELDMSNPTVQELVSAMRRGDIDQMSFAFEAVDAPVVQGVRELREVKLYDVSVVTFPWYDSTSVGLNEMDRARLALRALSPEQRALIEIEVNVTDSSVTDDSTETETEDDGMCPTCGQVMPMTEPPPPSLPDLTGQASRTTAEARALLSSLAA